MTAEDRCPRDGQTPSRSRRNAWDEPARPDFAAFNRDELADSVARKRAANPEFDQACAAADADEAAEERLGVLDV